MRSELKFAAALTAVLATAALSGCATSVGMGAKPWERDVLAEPAMQIGSGPVEVALDEHIYFSKEASTGGASFGGGGCGCN